MKVSPVAPRPRACQLTGHHALGADVKSLVADRLVDFQAVTGSVRRHGR